MLRYVIHPKDIQACCKNSDRRGKPSSTPIKNTSLARNHVIKARYLVSTVDNPSASNINMRDPVVAWACSSLEILYHQTIFRERGYIWRLFWKFGFAVVFVACPGLSYYLNQIDMQIIRRRLKSARSLSGTPTSNGQLRSLLFHVNRSFHSWYKSISNFNRDTSRSRSSALVKGRCHTVESVSN